MVNDVSAMMIAHVERELAELRAQDRAGTLPPRPSGGRGAASTVFSVRLDPEQVRVLQHRAEAAGIPPSVLARNLIRVGLERAAETARLGEAVARVESATADLRAALP